MKELVMLSSYICTFDVAAVVVVAVVVIFAQMMRLLLLVRLSINLGLLVYAAKVDRT
jgi:hypothetical protein